MRSGPTRRSKEPRAQGGGRTRYQGFSFTLGQARESVATVADGTERLRKRSRRNIHSEEQVFAERRADTEVSPVLEGGTIPEGFVPPHSVSVVVASEEATPA